MVKKIRIKPTSKRYSSKVRKEGFLRSTRPKGKKKKTKTVKFKRRITTDEYGRFTKK